MARQQRQFPQGKYILRSQNGSQNYAVYMYYYWKGKQVRHSVDLYVTPNDWNQDANGGAGEFLLFAFRRQLQGAETVLLGSHLHTFVDQVVVRAVTQAVRTVDHRHQRCRGGLLLVGVGLIDGIALLGTGSEE